VKVPKTARSARSLGLDGATAAALRDWRRAQLEERLRAGEAWAPGEWLAADEIGRPLPNEHVTRRFAEIAAEAGLPPITVPMLRHSHAAALLAVGESPRLVAERLGHSSVAVTLGTYAAVLPGMQRAAIDRLAAAVGV